MEAINFSPIGIVRNTPDVNSPDGGCQEIVNMRLKDGAWRALTPKTVKKANLTILENVSKYIVHQVRDDNYVIGLSETDNTVYVFYLTTNTIDQTLKALSSGESLIDITVFGKFLLITTNLTKYTFLYNYDGDTYNELPGVPEGKIWFQSTEIAPANVSLGALGEWENAVAAFRKLKYDDGQDGYFEGHTFFRTAWLLFDGSYILHSPVHYCRVGLYEYTGVYFRNQIFVLTGTDYYAGGYAKNNPLMWHIFSTDQKGELTLYKNLIRSLVVFMAKPIPHRDVNQEYPSGWFETVDETTIYPILNTNIEKSIENLTAFYKVHEIPFDDIVTNGVTSSSIIVENMESLETREPLPIDSFTNHIISGMFSKDYNSRLHLGDVSVKLLDSYNLGRYATDEVNIGNGILYEGYTKTDNNLIDYVPWEIHFEVELETDKGERITRRTPPVSLSNLGGCTLFVKTVGADTFLRLVLKEIITYPDTRAKKINVCITADDEYRLLASYDLKPHPVFNLAYFVGTLNSSDDTGEPNGYFEPNVIQISEAIITADDNVVATLPADQTVTETGALVALEDSTDVNDHFDDTAGVHEYIAFANGFYKFNFKFAVDTSSEPAECEFEVAWYKNGTKVQEHSFSMKFPFESTVTYEATLATSDEITIKVRTSIAPVNTVLLLQDAIFDCFIYPTSGTVTVPGTLFDPARPVSDIIRDENRLQVSELNNVFLYPAKNSYRIGTMQNTLYALATMSDPMSQGQFGQFPLHIFSKEGIYNLNQSQSPEVLYVNTVPLNKDVITGGMAGVVELGGAVVYATVNGLFILSGTQVKEIGQVLEGSLSIPVSAISHYLTLITHNYTAMISNISFLTVLSNITMAYDNVNRELIVAPRNANYSYVFSFDNSHWTKVGISYAAFYRGSEGLYGVEYAKTRIVKVDSESTATTTGLIHFFITRPMKLGSNGLKKIDRIILRGYQKLPTGKTSGVYVFASPDGKQWKMIRGINPPTGENTDMVIKRLHVSFRYIIIVYVSPVLTASISTYPLTLTDLVSQLQGFDVQIEQSYGGKLR